ncbi:hypothetical protein ACOME3_000319 [Neoechinorhynchus agilis]
MSEESANKLSSFWIPQLTPSSQSAATNKPSKTILCPVSGRPFDYKNLIPVKFKNSECEKDKFVCAVSGDTLTNSIPCAVLRPTGAVVTMKVVEIIKKDMIDPISSVSLTDDDIIPIARVGTGFTAGGGKLNAQKYTPVMD